MQIVAHHLDVLRSEKHERERESYDSIEEEREFGLEETRGRGKKQKVPSVVRPETMEVQAKGRIEHRRLREKEPPPLSSLDWAMLAQSCYFYLFNFFTQG